MVLSPSASFAVAVVVLTWWVVRMIRPRPLKRGVVGPGIAVLVVLGACSLVAGLASVRWERSAAFWAAGLCFVTLGIAGAAGWLRAATVRLRVADGVVVRRGTWLTVGAWLAWVAVHYLLDRAIDHVDPVDRLASSTLWSGLAISLAAQRYALHRRALAPAAIQP